MVNSSFRQPLPPRLRPMMAEGYSVGSGKPKGFEYVGPAPAGSLSATGEDMGRFMIAHLQGGALGGNRILQPQTAQLMHRGATTRAIPALNGMELGFYESDINGREVISMPAIPLPFTQPSTSSPERASACSRRSTARAATAR